MNLRTFLPITIGLWMLCLAIPAKAQVADPLWTPGILQDISSEKKSKRAYDWQKNSFELRARAILFRELKIYLFEIRVLSVINNYFTVICYFFGHYRVKYRKNKLNIPKQNE